MKLRGLPAEAGMAMVLLGLAVFFSVATWSEQPSTGAAAARPVVDRIVDRFGKEARVMVVSGGLPEEVAFAAAVEASLKESGSSVVARVTGEPRDARVALEELATKGGKLDAIAASALASSWLVFDAVEADFPGLGAPVLIAPERQRGSNFLKRENLLNIANQIAVIAIMAIGMTLVILTGGIDLSVGSLLALSAVVSTWLIREWAGGVEAGASGMVLFCAGGIAVCGLLGLVTGWLVTRQRVAPFLVTLALMLMASGAAYRLTSGESVYQVPDSFTGLGRGAALGLPNAVVLMLFLYGVAHLVMTRTVFGRHLYAVGGNRTAARLSGVPVERVVVSAYILSALFAGLGGVVMASQLKSGSPTYGEMYELYVIAAVVVGGTSLSGGRGSMVGTLLGAFTIAVIQNGMNLMNVESYTQKIVLGAVILGAVWLDRARRAGE